MHMTWQTFSCLDYFLGVTSQRTSQENLIWDIKSARPGRESLAFPSSGATGFIWLLNLHHAGLKIPGQRTAAHIGAPSAAATWSRRRNKRRLDLHKTEPQRSIKLHLYPKCRFKKEQLPHCTSKGLVSKVNQGQTEPLAFRNVSLKGLEFIMIFIWKYTSEMFPITFLLRHAFKITYNPKWTRCVLQSHCFLSTCVSCRTAKG